MQLWLSGSCALLCRFRLRLWLWPVYCPPDFIAHFRVLVAAGMWIWLWRIRSVLLIQAKKKNSARGPSFPFYLFISNVAVPSWSASWPSWSTSLQFIMFPMAFSAVHIHTNHDNAGHAPANPLAGILLLPIATLLSFYVKQVQHINLHLSLIF